MQNTSSFFFYLIHRISLLISAQMPIFDLTFPEFCKSVLMRPPSDTSSNKQGHNCLLHSLPVNYLTSNGHFRKNRL